MKLASVLAVVLLAPISVAVAWARPDQTPDGTFVPSKDVKRVEAMFSSTARANFRAVDSSADRQGFREVRGSSGVQAGTGQLKGQSGSCTYVLVTRERKKDSRDAQPRTVAHIEVTCKGVKQSHTYAWVRADRLAPAATLKMMKDEYSDPDDRRGDGGGGAIDGVAKCLQEGVLESCGTSAFTCLTTTGGYPACFAVACVGGTFASMAYCSARSFIDKYIW